MEIRKIKEIKLSELELCNLISERLISDNMYAKESLIVKYRETKAEDGQIYYIFTVE